MSVKHAFVWWCLTNSGLSDMQILDAGQNAGFEGVEMVPEKYWGEVHTRGLVMVSTQAHASIESGLNDRSQHDRIVAETTAQLEKAVKWGIPNLICFSGNRAGRNTYDSIATIIEGLARLAPLAEQAGVNLVLELLNSKVDHHDYQCDNTPFGVACVAPVNSPRIKLLYDAYHMQIMEGDLIRTVQQYHQHFGHYHIAGNPGRHEPDDSQEIHHPPLMRAIAATGYTGFVGHEYVPAHDAAQSLIASRRLLNVE